VIEVFSRMSVLKRKTITVCLFCLLLANCSTLQREPPVEQWPELQFIIDGKVEIRFVVPPAKAEAELFEPQFISTSSELTQTMLFASYDPGWGKNRGLLLTSITSTIIRIEQKLASNPLPSLEYIKNDIYLSRDDAAREFEIVGEVAFNDQPWLRVNLISGYRRGISYSTIIGGEYVHILSMSMFGENSDEKKLFQTRHDTLRSVINSTRMTIE
jgi:hypothetical protein